MACSLFLVTHIWARIAGVILWPPSRNSGWGYPDVFLNSKNFSNPLELGDGLDLALELPGCVFSAFVKWLDSLGHLSASPLWFPFLFPLTRPSSPNPIPAVMYQRCILGGSAFCSDYRGPVVLIVCDVSGRTPCSSPDILAGTWHGQSPSPSPQLQDEACQKEQRGSCNKAWQPRPLLPREAPPPSGGPPPLPALPRTLSSAKE